ncbi:MAG: amidohydrolase [Aureliella sp.]
MHRKVFWGLSAWLGIFSTLGVLRGQDSEGSRLADLVVRNVRIYQCDDDFGRSDAVAVKAGRIVAIGEDNCSKWIDPTGSNVVDAGGATLTPGFADSHLHYVGLGESLQMLDLRLAKSWDDIIEQVKQASEKVPVGTWIEGRGWHQSKWTQAPPENVDGYPVHTRMSQAVPNHPVLLTHASGHACFANARAMELAGVEADTKPPKGGEILRSADGLPCGVFRENAQGLVRVAKARELRKQTESERDALLRQRVELAGAECLRFGITSVHDAGSSFDLAEKMSQLAEEGTLPVRVYMMIRTGSTELAKRMPGFKRNNVGNGFFSVRSVKVSIDGALGPHGAWLLQPYSDLTNTSGLNTVSLEELGRVAKLCTKYSWQLCVHAIGDRANQEVLDAYAAALGGEVQSDHRWRIEHAQHLAPADIPRFGEMGVIPAMQANHCTSDAIFVPTRLGERRSREGAYVWRSLIDNGAIIPNGTDAPVELIDPRASLYASVTRQLKNGMQFFPEQCMTREEALLSYTIWPAYAAFQERELGSIEVGKRADFVLWDTDLVECPAEEILTAEVQATYLAGERVFEANQQTEAKAN